jgi:hypothetical protein
MARRRPGDGPETGRPCLLGALSLSRAPGRACGGRSCFFGARRGSFLSEHDPERDERGHEIEVRHG